MSSIPFVPFVPVSTGCTWCMAGWFKKPPRHHVDQHESLGFADGDWSQRPWISPWLEAGWFWILMSQEYRYIIYINIYIYTNPSSKGYHHYDVQIFVGSTENLRSLWTVERWTVSWKFISYMAMGSVLPSVVPGHPMVPGRWPRWPLWVQLLRHSNPAVFPAVGHHRWWNSRPSRSLREWEWEITTIS